jgi:hypothetical protein
MSTKPTRKAAPTAGNTGSRKPARAPAKLAPRKSVRRPLIPAPRRPQAVSTSAAASAEAASKQSRLIELLRSPAGGTIQQLTQLTGWQPHTVRGAIGGALRKRLKLNVTCVDSVYRIVDAEAS